MKMTDRRWQFTLTICIVALVVGAVTFGRMGSSPIVQIALSLFVISISVVSVIVSSKEKSEHVVNNEQAENIQKDAVSSSKQTPLETKSAPVVLHGHTVLEAIYENPSKAIPVYREGNHFVCDAEVEDNYSFSIGNVRLEVVGGEAKVVIKQPTMTLRRTQVMENQVPLKMIN